jgi:hypothetical protein
VLRHASLASICLASLTVVTLVPAARAARPSETLLPATTKSFVSVPDVDLMRKESEETQIGQLMKDPLMQPFIEDLRRQVLQKLSDAGVRLGLTIEDLDGVYGGEVCIAAIQPEPKQHAAAIIVDVTDHLTQAEALLAKVAQNLRNKGATRQTRQIGGATMIVFTLPRQPDELLPRIVCHVIAQNTLIAADHEKTATDILSRLAVQRTDRLANLPAFRATISRCQKESGDVQPHIRWFVEPFGYVEVLREAAGGRRQRGTDMLKVFSEQGFTAIQGVGGFVFFATDEHEILHRTFVYAPPAPGASGAEKYRLAARMLDFPGSDGLMAQPWIPRHAASYFTFNVKLTQAFEYSKTLVNALAGDEVFEDVLDSIRSDPSGPMVDIRKDLVEHLAERATVLSDYRLPITPKSERVMMAIELKDAASAEVVRRTVDRAMESDPNARKRVAAGHVIWEILNEEDTEEVLQLQIDGPGFGGFGSSDDQVDEEKPFIPNSAVTVAHNQLIVASHVDFVVELLQNAVQTETLTGSADYQLIRVALERLGAGQDSFRFFTRTDEAYRPTYELIRQGKMPEAETLLGRLLNGILGPEEEGVLRQQQIDGSKMPDYDAVRRYLGPGGIYARQETEGWLVVGCLLTKEAE